MILKCVTLLLCLVYVRTLNEGDACEAENHNAGVCKSIEECPFAYKQLENFKKPKMCRYKGTTKIVCCPAGGGNLGDIGAFRKYFGGTRNGILRGTDMTCRYEGALPILCCQNVKEALLPPEPPSCPPLNLPQPKPDDIAFKKCLEYQRYVQPCVADKFNPDALVREYACGFDQSENRITAGVPAGPKEFPHMALLGCRNEVDPALAPVQWVAGGSLISDKFILTAGHVMWHKDYGLLRYALLGAVNKTQAKDGVLFNIVRLIPHKLYAKNNKQHDIALLELDRKVDFSEFIRPACLPSDSLEMMSSNRILAGWGQTSTSKSSDVLMKVSVAELMYESECKARLPDSVNSIFNKDAMLCAGTIKGDSGDSCQGDSGGPLMGLARDLDCTFIVRGVVSFGPGCGEGPPGIYTNVKAYLPWIIEHVWNK